MMRELKKNRELRGFSLVELLAVLGVMAGIVGLAATAALPNRDHKVPEEAAQQLSQLMGMASQLAVEKRAPVRLVFVRQSVVTGVPVGEAERDPVVECVLYVFHVPKAGHQEVVWRTPGDSHAVRGGDALERIPVTAPGLPQELVGQWMRHSHHPVRFSKPDGPVLTFSSPLLEDFEKLESDEFDAKYLWAPPYRWQAGNPDPWSGFSQASPYPEDMAMVSYPQGAVLKEQALPATARLYDPQSASWVGADQFWKSDVPIPHFAVEEDEQTKWRLPCVDFDPTGRLSGNQGGALSFEFQTPTLPDLILELHWETEAGSRMDWVSLENEDT